MFSQRLGQAGRRRILCRGAQQRRGYAEAQVQGPTRRWGRGIGVMLCGVACVGAGAAAATTWHSLRARDTVSDAETLKRFVAQTQLQRRIEERINGLAEVRELRSRKDIFTESRPHLKAGGELRRQSMTAGSLQGPGALVVPPYVWVEEGGRSLVCVGYVGDEVCGYPGKVHGGFLATMLDEGMARCCFPAVPNNIAMTARLELDYRRPTEANEFFVMRARTVKVEGRKAWVEGRIETLPDEGQEPVVLVEAKSLFVSPKWASLLPRIPN